MSSSRYPKRRRVSTRDSEPTLPSLPPRPPPPESQVYNSSPDELAPSSDREKYHGRRTNSQTKRGSKSRKKSQPKIVEEPDPKLSILAAAAARADASDDELTATASGAEFATAADGEKLGQRTTIPSIDDRFDQSSNTTLPQSFNEVPWMPSDALRTPSTDKDADELPDAAPSPFVEDLDEDRPDPVTALPTEEGDEDMPDAASSPTVKHQQNDMPGEAGSNFKDRDDHIPDHPAAPPLRLGKVEQLPDDHQMPTFLRRRSTFKKSERQPHDRSTSRSPPPYSTYSIPAATPPEPLIGPPQYVPYRQIMVLKGHRRGVAAVRFSPNGRLIASSSADATIRIWDTATGNHLHTLEGHLAGISTIAWSPDSKTLASGSDDKSIRLWDVSTGKAHPHQLQAHSSYVYALSFSPRGNMLASGSYDEALFLWDVRTSRLMRSHPAHSDPIGGVDFVRDGTLIVSCAGDGLIRVWDTATGQCLRTLVHEDNAPVTGVRFSPNGKFVLAWTLDSSVRLWNYVEGRCVKTYQGHRNEKYSIGGAFGIYDNKEKTEQRSFAVSGSEDGSIFCWDVQSKEILQRMEAHDGVVMGVDTWPEGDLMVSVGVDKTVRIWGRDERTKLDSDEVEEEKVLNGIKDEEETKDGKEALDGVIDAADHSMLNGDNETLPNGKVDTALHDTDVVEQKDVSMVNGDAAQ